MNHRRDSSITIAVFLALLVGFSSAGYWLIFRLESATPLMLSVGLAAVVTCLIRGRDLASLGWGWGDWKYQWLSYALPLCMITAAYLLIWSGGFGQWYDASFVLEKQQSYHLDGWSNVAVITFHFVVTATLSFLLLLPSVLGEELGWRGFLVPELSKRMPFTGVALVSGLLWAVWHWPMIFMGIYGSKGTPLYFQLLVFTLFITANAFTLAYLRLKSNSVWTAVIFHMSSNVFLQKFFTPMTAATDRSAWYVDEFGVAPALVALLVACYFWRKGKAEFFFPGNEHAGRACAAAPHGIGDRGKTVINLPQFDTGQYEGCELRMVDGGATLSIRIAELPAFNLHFSKVRWHQFTALPNCTATMIEGSYFALSEVSPSRELSSFLASDRSSVRAYRELHHYRILLDETGCHEFFAESAHVAP